VGGLTFLGAPLQKSDPKGAIMALAKNPFFYKNIHDTIEAYGNRHSITARQHFAPMLGYTGKNGDIQLASALNYSTYNPATPKPITVDQLLVVLDECDEERDIILDNMCKRYGGQYVRGSQCNSSSEDHLKDDLLKISALAGNLSNMFLEYKHNDGVIDDKEAEDLEKIAHAARRGIKEFEDHVAALKKQRQE